MIFPAITETLVLPLDASEVEQRISKGIEEKKFNGVVSRGSFSLSAHLIRPPQFSPVTRGRIENSSRGSMIFLKYELQPATKVLLVFVFLIFIVLAAVSVAMKAELYYTMIALGMVLVLRSVALINIRLHRDPVRQHLLNILS